MKHYLYLFILDFISLRFLNFYTKSKTEKQMTSQSLRVDRTNKGMRQILEEKYHFIRSKRNESYKMTMTREI